MILQLNLIFLSYFKFLFLNIINVTFCHFSVYFLSQKLLQTNKNFLNSVRYVIATKLQHDNLLFAAKICRREHFCRFQTREKAIIYNYTPQSNIPSDLLCNFSISTTSFLIRRKVGEEKKFYAWKMLHNQLFLSEGSVIPVFVPMEILFHAEKV